MIDVIETAMTVLNNEPTLSSVLKWNWGIVKETPNYPYGTVTTIPTMSIHGFNGSGNTSLEPLTISIYSNDDQALKVLHAALNLAFDSKGFTLSGGTDTIYFNMIATLDFPDGEDANKTQVFCASSTFDIYVDR